MASASQCVQRFLSHSYYEGVVDKQPYGEYLSGRVSRTRGRVKNYTILDCVLIGVNERAGSFQVGLWKDENRVEIILIRNVETIEKEIIKDLLSVYESKKTTKRPAYIRAGPASDFYLSEPLVVAVQCDGIIIPNNGYRFTDTEWLLHDAATIKGFYPEKKTANTLDRLYSLKKYPN